jgi:hypothetical protein
MRRDRRCPTPVRGTTIFHEKQITYEARSGVAIYQIDMILGPQRSYRPLARQEHKGLRPDASTIRPGISAAVAFWPAVSGVVQVPYTITTATTAKTDNINAAITEANAQLAGIVRSVPATSQANYVNFDFNPDILTGACEATVGMVGGEQMIGGSVNCTETSIMHEMGMRWVSTTAVARRSQHARLITWSRTSTRPTTPISTSSPIALALISTTTPQSWNAAVHVRQGRCLANPRNDSSWHGASTSTPQYTTGDLDGIMRLYGACAGSR